MVTPGTTEWLLVDQVLLRESVNVPTDFSIGLKNLKLTKKSLKPAFLLVRKVKFLIFHDNEIV